MDDLILIGAGTMAGFVLNIIEGSRRFRAVALYDDTVPTGTTRHGIPVLGTVYDVPQKEGGCAVITVGLPTLRQRLFTQLSAKGYALPPLLHPMSLVAADTFIGDGVILGPFSTLLTGSRLERGCCLLSHVNINQNVTVGEFSLIGAGATVGNGAVIGPGAHLGMRAIVDPDEVVAAHAHIRHT